MQEFTEHILPNGIRLYHYAADFPVSSFEIMLPIGAGHAGIPGGTIPNGAPHFLEHMQMLRSEKFPEKSALERMIGLQGGYDNAHTHDEWTSFEITVPAPGAEQAFVGLCDRVFHPLFNEEDLLNQRQIITTERDQDRIFFPGSSPSTHYYNQQFMWDAPIRLDRIFGSETDLNGYNPDMLKGLHKISTTADGVVVYSAGSHDPGMLARYLEELPALKSKALASFLEPARWVNPTYHETAFDNVTQPSLDVAWISSRVSFAEYVGVEFLLQAFCNSVHGVLYEILRHERGWIYDLDAYAINRSSLVIGMTFPVMDTGIIQEIRTHIFEWMAVGVGDQKRMEDEVQRRLHRRVTWCETASSTVEGGTSWHRAENRLVTFQEWEAAITQMRDPKHRQDFFAKYFNKDAFGEMAFLPSA
jgi:predicted Zn-dependent peptidase